MKIGTVEIHGYTALAPMAGVADHAFRAVCKQFGASYVVGEMASAKGMAYGDRKSGQLLAVTGAERPMAVQLFGTDPELMAQCARAALENGPDVVDINMGCPAPKIVGGGAGSALMREPVLAQEIVRAVVRACGDVPVTVKIRKGWDAEHENAVELALRAQEAGAAAVTVHGRTRAQMYAGHADLSSIAAVAEALDIPVIGNGDVTDGVSAARMLRETGCALVMVGRGALGRPWVFNQIERFCAAGEHVPEPPLAVRLEVLRDHVARIVVDKGERTALREARKHAGWYFTGMRGAAALRRQAGTLETFEDLLRLCEQAGTLPE